MAQIRKGGSKRSKIREILRVYDLDIFYFLKKGLQIYSKISNLILLSIQVREIFNDFILLYYF